MVTRVDILCDVDKQLMLEFSGLCISRLVKYLPLKLFFSVFQPYLDANVLKEIEKDRLIIEHAAAAFERGSDRTAVNVNELFEMTKKIDDEFVGSFSVTFFSMTMCYADFAEIRKKRILAFADMVFDLLENWREGLPFADVVKRTFGEERYTEILGGILHLYNVETKILSNSMTFCGPAAKLRGLFAEKLFVTMERTAGEIAAAHAHRTYSDKAYSYAGFGSPPDAR
jgi:hypothetical protein